MGLCLFGFCWYVLLWGGSTALFSVLLDVLLVIGVTLLLLLTACCLCMVRTCVALYCVIDLVVLGLIVLLLWFVL